MNPLGQNVPQRELKSMPEILFTSIIEIKQLSKQNGYIIQVGNRWTGLFLAKNDRTEYSVKRIARKSWKTAKKAINFSKYPKIL